MRPRFPVLLGLLASSSPPWEVLGLGESTCHFSTSGGNATRERLRQRGRRRQSCIWKQCRSRRIAAVLPPDAAATRDSTGSIPAAGGVRRVREASPLKKASRALLGKLHGGSVVAAISGGGAGRTADEMAGLGADLAAEAAGAPPLTSFVSECVLPTARGEFRLRAYRHDGPGKPLEPVVMISGDISSGRDVPVRVHDQCLTSEVLGSRRCDCKAQLEMSLDYIKEHGGVVIYLQQEGRGIGLANKVAAYALQDRGLDTVDANRHLGFEDDERSYEAVEHILKDLGITSVQLMTNNPYKIRCIEAMGVKVQSRIPMLAQTNEHNRGYLLAKARRMSHFLQVDGAAVRAAAAGAVGGAAAAAASAVGASAATVAVAAAAGAVAGAAAPAAAAADTGDTPSASAGAAMRSAGKRRRGAASVVRGGDGFGDGFADGYKNDGFGEFADGGLDAYAAAPLQPAEATIATERENGAAATATGTLPGYTAAFGRASAEAAVLAVREGRAVVVVDDEDRENEGDVIFAASAATPEMLAFTIRHSSGVICVAMEEARLQELRLPQMVPDNQDPKKTAFTLTVDSRRGVSTGISAGDRARTIRDLADPSSTSADFNRPGHIFPLCCRPGGVLERAGHTEAAVDLCRLAGLPPVGVLCELTTADGLDMARVPELQEFSRGWGLVMTTIQDLRQLIGSGDWRAVAVAPQRDSGGPDELR